MWNPPGGMVGPSGLAFVHPRYEAGPVLGAGAQGVVFRVIDREEPGHALVAKLWRPGLLGDEALRGEFALLMRLRVAGLVRGHDLGREQTSGASFLIEDFVDGPDASEWVHEAPGAEREARLERLLEEVAGTLGALHDAGFLHGDLKPAHVRVPAAGRARLLDLGAAIGSGVEAPVAMSPGFAAPELRAGGRPSPASDLYGLGALAWAVATGAPPARARGALRDRAPWVRPSLAEVVEALVAEHPGDRPGGARAVLTRLGASGRGRRAARPEASHGGPTVGRDEVLRRLHTDEGPPVRYLIGPSGVGKSHLAREVLTAALLEGREARGVSFPLERSGGLAGLLAFLRGDDEALPFVRSGQGPLLLVLDELHRAPGEVTAALDAYRCRGQGTVRVLAVARSAPEGASTVEVGALSAAELTELCRRLGEDDEARIEAAVRSAGGNPGWMLAALGRVPLTVEAARERLATVAAPARELFAAAVRLGGVMTTGWARGLAGAQARARLGELLEAGLLDRRQRGEEAVYALASAELTAGLREAVATLVDDEAVAAVVLADERAPAAALLALAGVGEADEQGTSEPGEAPAGATRVALLRAAAARARLEGGGDDERRALRALGAEPSERTAAVVSRLERLTRDAGQGAMHAQVLGWLDAIAQDEPALGPLARRRRAEALAREGQSEQAEAVAAEALSLARSLGDPEAEALALATVGAVALFRSAWDGAYEALHRARGMLSTRPPIDDPEEVARLDHNFGVVAIYRGQIVEAIEAFERSRAVKQRLGDRAGVRACLRNLGYALTRAGRLDEAARALDEALALARSLGQATGRAWCLSARAEVEVRRGQPRAAESFIAEAESLGAAVPGAVAADLCILRAEAAVLEGDGAAALRGLGALAPATRSQDALVDARAWVVEARAHLSCVPASRRWAARAAVAAVRRARTVSLPEPEAQGLAVLRQVRSRRAPVILPALLNQVHPGAMETTERPDESALWAWLERVGEGQPREEAALDLARSINAHTGAERTFVARCVGDAGEVSEVWAVDLDGLALGDAGKRLPVDAVRAALARSVPLYQPATPTAAGKGARLALASSAGPSGRFVLVLEHRFAPGRFDALAAPLLDRWRTLAAVLGRLAPASALLSATAATGERAPDQLPPARPVVSSATTVLPTPVARREFPLILGQSEPLRRVLARLDQAIDSDLPVLIVGETGVGKELFARALHENGPRAAASLVAVNCAAIPDNLFEAELFGHARGSFTGADRSRPGLIARAEGGTLFLDEIGELAPARQASLLRVLESRRYRPVGSDEERPANVRLVAATNVDLERAVEKGAFRRDLLFRLDVLRLQVPPLRERVDDVALLVRHFLERAGSSSSVSPAALAALVAYPWPGNVRELEHHLQRLGSLRLDRLELGHLPREIRAHAPASAPASPPSPAAPVDERAEVIEALDACGGNISQAARRLGLTRHGLKKRLLRLGLRPPSETSTP